MRPRTKRQQREYVPRRARELARSGEFPTWWSIEVHLRHAEGCPEARHVLDNEAVREELDRLCREARESAP